MTAAFVFDLDGTLFDSSNANLASYIEAFKQNGLVLNQAKYISCFGLRFQEMMDQLAPETDDATRAAIKKDKATIYKNNIDLVKPNAGLLALVEELSKSHKTALVSTASKINIENLLGHFLPDKKLFDVVIVGEDVTRGKPDSEAYDLAFEKLGVDAFDCVIFEDSNVGIEAALKTGAKVVKVRI